MDKQADFQIVDLKQQQGQSHFSVIDKNAGHTFPITLNMPGLHNALNATAGLAVARNLGVPIEACQRALLTFAGVNRRFNILGEVQTDNGTVTLVDDYGHHPTEIAATFAAVRGGWADNRLVVIFQPHRYTRTRDLFEDFAQVLSEADLLIVMEVYPAGEAKIAGADAKSLCRAIRLRGMVEPIFVEDKQELVTILPSVLNQGDLVLTLGAGDIGRIARELPEKLGGKS
jgi:UDP-N-acetylmuramate--alanine ligase